MKFNEVRMLTESAVFSSWIEDLEYDGGNTIMTLLSGIQYVVHNVPDDVHEEWLEASSKGKFWHSDIAGLYVVTRG